MARSDLLAAVADGAAVLSFRPRAIRHAKDDAAWLGAVTLCAATLVLNAAVAARTEPAEAAAVLVATGFVVAGLLFWRRMNAKAAEQSYVTAAASSWLFVTGALAGMIGATAGNIVANIASVWFLAAWAFYMIGTMRRAQ